MLSVEDTAIPAVKIVTPKKFGDHRGFFSEVYKQSDLAAAGIDLVFVQDNHSLSAPSPTRARSCRRRSHSAHHGPAGR